MTFTKNIVIETLNQYRGSQYLGDSGRTYRWVAMLPEDPYEMNPDILYVCALSEALKRNPEAPGNNYLCIRDCFTDDEDEAERETMRGFIVLNENKSVSWLLNIIQKRFLEISEWVLKMQAALIGNCDYQRLLDISEPILNNFVSVFDSSYTLLAYTKNIEGRDPVTIELVEKGYHSDEVLQKFRGRRRFEVYEQEQGVVISAPGEVSQYEILTKWCRYGGELMLQVVVECSRTPLSPASVDLFEIFMEYVDIHFQRQQRAHPSQIYTSLLHEILYEGLSNPFVIGERAKTADIPLNGYFDAYRIVFEDNSTILVGRFVQELMAYLPKSRIVAHNYEIVSLNVFNSPNVQKQSRSNLTKLQPLLKKYSAICGVSEVFASLPGLVNAYIQATRAQTLGVQLRTLGNYWNFDSDIIKVTSIENNDNVFFYNDIYIYLAIHIAQSGTVDAFDNTSYNTALKKLMDYDAENKTRLVQVLYAYLISERRATAAGKILNMHRNNVLYHISRIEAIADIDLDDYWARLKLLLAFHFFELQESNRLFYNPGGHAVDNNGGA